MVQKHVRVYFPPDDLEDTRSWRVKIVPSVSIYGKKERLLLLLPKGYPDKFALRLSNQYATDAYVGCDKTGKVSEFDVEIG